MSTTRLPVLFLTDLVVLPGMVVPIELDDSARAAVDAARSHSDGACSSLRDSRIAMPRTRWRPRSSRWAGCRAASPRR